MLDTHREIADDLEEKTDKGFRLAKAVDRVSLHYYSNFDGLSKQDADDEDEEDMQLL